MHIETRSYGQSILFALEISPSPSGIPAQPGAVSWSSRGTGSTRSPTSLRGYRSSNTLTCVCDFCAPSFAHTLYFLRKERSLRALVILRTSAHTLSALIARARNFAHWFSRSKLCSCFYCSLSTPTHISFFVYTLTNIDFYTHSHTHQATHAHSGFIFGTHYVEQRMTQMH